MGDLTPPPVISNGGDRTQRVKCINVRRDPNARDVRLLDLAPKP